MGTCEVRGAVKEAGRRAGIELGPNHPPTVGVGVEEVEEGEGVDLREQGAAALVQPLLQLQAVHKARPHPAQPKGQTGGTVGLGEWFVGLGGLGTAGRD